MPIWVTGLVLCSALLHALWNLFAKKARGDLAVVTVGMGLAALAAIPLTGWVREPIGRSGLEYVLCRGALQSLFFVTLGLAYRTGDLSFVYPVAGGTGVAASALLGSFVLHERIAAVSLIGMCLVVGGMLTLAEPKQRLTRPLLLALLTGGNVGLMSLNDKRGVAIVRPETYIFLIHAVCFFCLSSGMALRGHARALGRALRSQWRPATVIGVGSMVSYLLVLIALRHAKVSAVAPVREISVVLGASFGFVLLGERVSARKLLGLVAITVGAALVPLGKG